MTTRILLPPDCGNSPRNILVAELAVALALGDGKAIRARVTDTVTWQVAGGAPNVGVEAVVAAAATMARKRPETVTILHAISHGKTGAVHGSLSYGKLTVQFVDLIELTGAAGKKATQVTSFHAVDRHGASRTPRASRASSLTCKRIYDPPAPADGRRVLVDRLWPRGLSKPAARVDFWAREIAPSTALRQWYGHDPAKWDEFRRRYFKELDAQPAAVAELRAQLGTGRATLLFSSKEPRLNNATALVEYLSR